MDTAMVKARQAEYAPNRRRRHVARQRPPKGTRGAIEGPFITSHDGFNQPAY